MIHSRFRTSYDNKTSPSHDCWLQSPPRHTSSLEPARWLSPLVPGARQLQPQSNVAAISNTEINGKFFILSFHPLSFQVSVLIKSIDIPKIFFNTA